MSVIKIKAQVITLFIFSILVLSTNSYAQTSQETKAQNKAQTKAQVKAQVKASIQHGPRFVDADGDGICDHAIDTNGDGIPDQRGNAQRPMDGTGRKNRMGKGHGMGIKGGGQGTGTGTGVCDGTGPKGRMNISK